MSGHILKPDYPEEESLVCNALVREISEAKNWFMTIDAWSALLKVRRQAKKLRDEHNREFSQPESMGVEEKSAGKKNE